MKALGLFDEVIRARDFQASYQLSKLEKLAQKCGVFEAKSTANDVKPAKPRKHYERIALCGL